MVGSVRGKSAPLIPEGLDGRAVVCVRGWERPMTRADNKVV
jgi:hypothetical protein